MKEVKAHGRVMFFFYGHYKQAEEKTFSVQTNRM